MSICRGFWWISKVVGWISSIERHSVQQEEDEGWWVEQIHQMVLCKEEALGNANSKNDLQRFALLSPEMGFVSEETEVQNSWYNPIYMTQCLFRDLWLKWNRKARRLFLVIPRLPPLCHESSRTWGITETNLCLSLLQGPRTSTIHHMRKHPCLNVQVPAEIRL